MRVKLVARKTKNVIEAVRERIADISISRYFRECESERVRRKQRDESWGRPGKHHGVSNIYLFIICSTMDLIKIPNRNPIRPCISWSRARARALHLIKLKSVIRFAVHRIDKKKFER